MLLWNQTNTCRERASFTPKNDIYVGNKKKIKLYFWSTLSWLIINVNFMFINKWFSAYMFFSSFLVFAIPFFHYYIAKYNFRFSMICITPSKMHLGVISLIFLLLWFFFSFRYVSFRCAYFLKRNIQCWLQLEFD